MDYLLAIVLCVSGLMAGWMKCVDIEKRKPTKIGLILIMTIVLATVLQLDNSNTEKEARETFRLNSQLREKELHDTIETLKLRITEFTTQNDKKMSESRVREQNVLEASKKAKKEIEDLTNISKFQAIRIKNQEYNEKILTEFDNLLKAEKFSTYPESHILVTIARRINEDIHKLKWRKNPSYRDASEPDKYVGAHWYLFRLVKKLVKKGANNKDITRDSSYKSFYYKTKDEINSSIKNSSNILDDLEKEL